MQNLSIVEWGSSPTIDITLAYEHQRSGADMQYRVKTSIASLTGERYFGYPIYLELTLAGRKVLTQTLKAASPSQWSSPIEFTSEWFTVTNKTDGTTSASFRIYSGSGSSRNVTYSFALSVDPAGSAISASDGTLGVLQTISLTRYSPDFTDSLLWECGSSFGTIATKSSNIYFPWAPPIALAAENVSGDAVVVTLKCQTYDGDTLIQERTFTISETIPASVKPSVSMAISDHENLVSTYGAYIQGQSALDIVVTPTLAYGSPISEYTIRADGKTYTTTPTTTPALSGSGTLRIAAMAKDGRGRSSDWDTEDITVLPWVAPILSALTCERCLQDGTPNSEGAYMLVTFNAEVSPLGNQNSAEYVLQYKRSDAQAWTSQTLTSYADQYSVTGGSVVVPADVSYSYDAQIVATDDFVSTVAPTTGVGIAFDLIDFRSTGKGITFGRIATEDGFTCAMDAEFEGDVTHNGDSIALLAYPVGAIYISVSSTDPGTIFGGTWQQIQDVFLLAAGSTYAAGSTGGEASHTLTVDEIPSHTHEYPYAVYATATSGSNRRFPMAGNFASTQPTGGGQAHNNLPPYLAVYVWQRIA